MDMDALALKVADAIAAQVMPTQEALARRLAGVEADCVSLRAALAAVSGAGQRRRIEDVRSDPESPDRLRLIFDDKSHAILSVEAYRALSNWADAQPVGHA